MKQKLLAASILASLAFSTSSLAEGQRFGEQLFKGNFKENSVSVVDENYIVSHGDKIVFHSWGAYSFDKELTVDNAGKIYLPTIGGIKVSGTKYKDLNKFLRAQVGKVYTQNVELYTAIDGTTPVEIFVTGRVANPGSYIGKTFSSVLSFIDMAGGITDSGSYVNISIVRDGEKIETSNLHSFMLEGTLPAVHFKSGDSILVEKKGAEITYTDLENNTFNVEMPRKNFKVKDLLSYVSNERDITHVKIKETLGDSQITYLPLKEALSNRLENGDEVTFVKEVNDGDISVTVNGSFEGNQEIVLPKGATISALLEKISPTETSNFEGIQLYRKSVKEQQKKLIDESLNNLKKSVLTTRSATADETTLRTNEADLILRWVEEAKQVEPTGQVVLNGNFDDFIMEDGDIINIPSKNNVITVSGEVLFPRSIAYSSDMNLEEYINTAGGYSQNEDTSKILVLKPSGKVFSFEADSRKSRKFNVAPGDSVMVLPNIDVKRVQYAKEMSQIIYQIAVAASVVIGL